MRKITLPNFNVTTVFKDCISNMQNQSLKIELTNSLTLIQNAENDFNLKKQTNNIHLIKRNVIISKRANAQVLKSIYTDRLVNKKNSARAFYDIILISAPKEKCPLCNQRIADTLDHYLPKSEYPILSVSPFNLIPACTPCNKGKLINYPSNSEEETLHPYFDNIETEKWLKCELISTNPMIFNYFVFPPSGWNLLLVNRVKNHFDSFKINKLYKTHASEEFENIKLHLEKLYINGKTLLLKEHLLDAYNSRNQIDKNSWQTAFYESLFNNQDFCNGKFTQKTP